MKKFLSVILVLIMCLSFTACGNNEETSQEANAGSISENSSSTTSEETTEESENSSETSEVTSEIDDGLIEITTDNWQDYFELGYDLDLDYKDDGVTLDGFNLYPSIFIKDGYKVAEESGKVSLVFDAKYEWRYVFLNKADLTYEIGEICDTHEPGPDQVLDTWLSYHEEFDDPDFAERYYSWLDSCVSYTAEYTAYEGDIPLEDLFYYSEKEEDGVQLFKAYVQKLPVITCTEASGKVAVR